MQQYSHWHYILGYLIILTAHNWPVMIAFAMTMRSVGRLYRKPTRTNVQYLYGWSLLVFTYEYIKHFGDELARPIGFLFTMEWAWMVPTLVFLITRVPIPIMLLLALSLLLSALGSMRVAQKDSWDPASDVST